MSKGQVMQLKTIKARAINIYCLYSKQKKEKLYQKKGILCVIAYNGQLEDTLSITYTSTPKRSVNSDPAFNI